MHKDTSLALTDQQLETDCPEVTRVSVLLLYLYQKVENELNTKRAPSGKEAIKVLEISQEVKTQFEDEVNTYLGRAPTLPQRKEKEITP